MQLINETIGSYTTRKFNYFNNNEALVFVEDGRRFTYSELNNEIDKVAKGLIAIGVKKGDHVALLAYNSPEWIIVFLAILKIGAVAVCLNYSAAEEEVDYMLRKSDSTILIVSDENVIEEVDVEKFKYLKIIVKMKMLFNLSTIINRMDRIIDEEFNAITSSVKPSDIATILYTSGTTGNPKGIVFDHKAVLNGPLSFQENFNYTSEDRILVGLPLNHILGGKYTVVLGLLAGSTVVLMNKFRTSVALKAIESEKCTAFHGVPTMYQYILNKHASYDISSLRVGMVAGAVSSETLMKEIMEKMNISALTNAYGQTETLGVTQTLIKDKDHSKINTVGRAVSNIEMKICHEKTGEVKNINEEGELYIKTPYKMIGYYNDEEATNKTLIDGWIRTGDLGTIDEEGYVTISGRIKDVIIRGGENISPMYIENKLVSHEDIETAIIVGVPDENLGEEIFAFIKLNEGASLTRDDIVHFLSGKIARYKFPKYIDFIEQFPLTATGKIKRNDLKEIATNKIKENLLIRVIN